MEHVYITMVIDDIGNPGGIFKSLDAAVRAAEQIIAGLLKGQRSMDADQSLPGVCIFRIQLDRVLLAEESEFYEAEVWNSLSKKFT